jgi:RNA polymerase sigma-70 factor, ECF subfamily
MGLRLMTSPTEPLEDEETALVARAMGGEAQAFQELVERHQERVFGLVRHYTRNPAEVEDLAQETFLKAFRRLESFQGQASFFTWLHRIAVNTCLDFLKRKSRSPVATVEDPEAVGQGGQVRVAPPHARLEREEIARVTHLVLDGLPEIFRTVLVLREFEGHSYQEIADLVGVSIGTVESRLFRARARFKRGLVERFPEYALGPDGEGVDP